MKYLDKLIEVTKRKYEIDKTNSWSKGSITYLFEIINEIKEVEEELTHDRICYLEDELGDILWDYLNLVINLENERGVELSSIIERAFNKYDERISGIENCISWDIIKENQKEKLNNEQITLVENAWFNV